MSRSFSNPNAACLFAEFRFRMPSLDAKLDNLLCPAAPSLDKTTQIKHVCDQRIAWPGWVLALEIFRLQPEGQDSITPYLQPIIVDGEAHCAAYGGIIAMAQGVDQAFAQRFGRKERLVFSFEEARHNPSRYRQMPPQEKHRLFQ